MSRGPYLNGQTLRWGGHRSQALTKRVIWRDGGICWICNRPGATTADHVLPRKDFPEWTWSIDNLRAAHSRCNTVRGNTNASRYSVPDWLDYLDGFGIGDEHPAVRAALAGLGIDPVARERPVSRATEPRNVSEFPDVSPAPKVTAATAWIY